MSGAKAGRVLRSGKGKARVVREKSLVIGLVRDWSKRTVIISSGSQCILEDVRCWGIKGRFAEVEAAIEKAAEAGVEMFEVDKSNLHLHWMESEEGSV